jgi:ACS family allantoate permease-like MFS transporter
MLHAIPSTFGPFFALRFLLGMLESCVAPILILIISMFYKKDEQASRISWFYVMVRVSFISTLLVVTCIFQNGLTAIFGGFVAYVRGIRAGSIH